MKQALIRDKRYPNLYLLPSAQTRDKTAVNPEQMIKLIDDLRDDFDYILLDCPAGIEQGFKNAIAGADRALVVTTPEVSAIRDADRIVGLLDNEDISSIHLIVNRVRLDMVRNDVCRRRGGHSGSSSSGSHSRRRIHCDFYKSRRAFSWDGHSGWTGIPGYLQKAFRGRYSSLSA